MQHAQPFGRALPRRALALTAGSLVAVALLVGAGFALLQQEAGTPSVTHSDHLPKAPPQVPLRPRSHISVLVLNGNGISGAAGGAASDLLAVGYRHAIPSDAPSLDYPRSLVLFRPGWQREAERLSRDARIPTVAPLDGRVAPAYAHVPLVVILGSN